MGFVCVSHRDNTWPRGEPPGLSRLSPGTPGWALTCPVPGWALLGPCPELVKTQQHASGTEASPGSSVDTEGLQGTRLPRVTYSLAWLVSGIS